MGKAGVLGFASLSCLSISDPQYSALNATPERMLREMSEALAEAFALIVCSGESVYEAELHRLKGELLLAAASK